MTFYKFAVGVVLAMAMMLVLGMAALVFSARDFQFGVAQFSPATNGLISFERLAEVESQIERIEEESGGPRGEYLEIEQRLAALETQAQSAGSDADEARAAMVGAIATLEARADARPAASAAADLSAAALNQRVSLLASRTGLSPADQQSVAALRTQAQQLFTQEEALTETGAERAALETRQRLVGGQVSEANRRIYALQELFRHRIIPSSEVVQVFGSADSTG